MYLEAIAKKNPALISAAASLHQEGIIPPNTYVIDINSVRNNASVLAKEAKKVGIYLYFMSKHFNRNPLLAHTVMSAGIPSAVAVDIQCAQALHYHGIKVGHVGHLVQTPKHSIKTILEMEPEVITVFSIEKAHQISEAAINIGKTQDILIRVRDHNDIIYPNEEGGILIDELPNAAKEIAKLNGVNITGVTTFPATLFNPSSQSLEATVNFSTVRRARDILTSLGFQIKQINAPGASATLGLKTVAENGGTHAEPGHAITGTTPSVLYNDTNPEVPAMVYLSEVSHIFDKKAYVMGGGFYACDTPANQGDDSSFHTNSWVCNAFVGGAPEEILERKVEVDIDSFFGRTNNATDYYGGTLIPASIDNIRVGDTVIYGFRAQAFTMRSNIAVVDNIKGSPRLLGLFDRSNNLLDSKGYPVENSKSLIQDMLEEIPV